MQSYYTSAYRYCHIANIQSDESLEVNETANEQATFCLDLPIYNTYLEQV